MRIIDQKKVLPKSRSPLVVPRKLAFRSPLLNTRRLLRLQKNSYHDINAGAQIIYFVQT